jgi:hypothetical protein
MRALAHCSSKSEAASARSGAASRLPVPVRESSLESLLGNRAFRELIGTGTGGQPHRCSCGGTCSDCSGAERWPFRPERKSLESEADDELEKLWAPSRDHGACGLPHAHGRDGQPHQGAATIVCDGAGDYRVQLNSWAGAKCGIEACVRRHEESHAADWRKRWPDGCKNADGSPKADGAQIPLGGPGYDEFLKKSECDAYTTEVPCEETALAGASKECKPYVQGVLDDTKKQQAKYCGGGC